MKSLDIWTFLEYDVTNEMYNIERIMYFRIIRDAMYIGGKRENERTD